MTKIININSSQLQEMIYNNEAILIDVREDFEHLEFALKDSIHIKLSEIDVCHPKLPKNTNKKLIFYCKSGIRSLYACKILQEQEINYDIIYNLSDNISNLRNKLI